MAVSTDPAFISAIVAAEHRRNTAHARNLAERRQELRAEALRLVPLLLACDPDVSRIRLFGSVLPRRRLRPGSDLDLAVEGARRFVDLLRIAEDSDYPVDLVEWETLAEPIRNVIAGDAEVLYGA